MDSPYCDFAESYYNWGVFENAMKWSNMEPEYNTFQTYNMELSFAWSEVKDIGYRGFMKKLLRITVRVRKEMIV